MKRASCNVRMTPKGWIEYDIVAVWPNGEHERERRRCPLQTLTGARSWAKEREQEIYRLGPPSTRRELARYTWTKLMPEFRRLHFTSGPRGALKPSQTASIESHWTNHIAPFWGWRALEETNPRLIAEWIAGLQAPYQLKKNAKKKRSGKTINNILTTFNTMLNRAEEWELAPRGLPRAKLFRLARPEIDFYAARDFETLVDAAHLVGTDAKIAILLGARAGLRAGEILALRSSDLHAVKNELLVQRAIWNEHTGAPKGGKPRRVPVGEVLAELLRKKRGYVLARPDGKPLTIRRLRALLQAVEREAGFRPSTGKIHKLRHTYASHLVMAGVPLVVVQELLGHTDISTTMRYAHLAPTAKDDAVRALDGESWETIRDRPKIARKVERETGFEPVNTSGANPETMREVEAENNGKTRR